MSISCRSGAKVLKRLIWLKYYFVLKRQSTFSLGLNVAKNTYQIEKIQIVQNEISYKKVNGRICLFPPGVDLGISKDEYVEILLYWNGKVNAL